MPSKPDKSGEIPFIDLLGPDCHVQWTGEGMMWAIAELKRRRAKRRRLYALLGLEPPADTQEPGSEPRL